MTSEQCCYCLTKVMMIMIKMVLNDENDVT